MIKKLIITFCVIGVSIIFSFAQNHTTENGVNYKVHTFYYGWYGNPEYDGKYHHWNHQIIPHHLDSTWNNAGNFPGGDDISANFYPESGSYSSNDSEIITRHMKQIKDAGIGVLAISWWGKDSYTDNSVSTYLDIANQFQLKITFHIEPVYSSIEQFKEIVNYINSEYGNHPAFFRHNGKPFYYIYDSGKVKYPEWNKLLATDGELSIRNTPLDAIFIGHWERERDGGFITKSGFDGFYTYYASEGFMYGCTSSNWPVMAEFARQNNLIFIPCPGPGYIDTRIRPWNRKNTEDRDYGNYYERMFRNAAAVNPDYLAITSFNEWHEGTQIEPAVPKTIPSFTYLDYGNDIEPSFYLKKTRELIGKYFK